MRRESFNHDWVFYVKDRPNEKRQVTLPFDGMLIEKRNPLLQNGSLLAFFPGNNYVYEKTLFGDEKFDGKCVILDFGGSYMDTKVYFNGEEVGSCYYGYSNFFVDITGKIKIGEDNLIRVTVHNAQRPNGRWYTGGGLYRPVHILVGEKEHMIPDGIKIVTRSLYPAKLEVNVECEKSLKSEVLTEIIYDGEVVASGKGEHCFISVPDAKLWSAETPNLYEAKTTLINNGVVIDEVTQRIGIRTLKWNAKEGLLVNGVSTKLRGVCVHQDNGMLGMNEYKESELRRVRRLKEGGFNAIRGSHDPRSREFLEACDEIGMYVMEEGFDVWFEAAGQYGYGFHFEKEWRKDLTTMIRKAVNHPSVVIYSIGNEIAETASEKGVEIGREMVKLCHELDDSRPVTLGINLMLNVIYSKNIKLSLGGVQVHDNDPDQPNASIADTKKSGSVFINTLVGVMGVFMGLLTSPKNSDKPIKGICDVLDIAGYNYGLNSYARHHEKYPDRIIVGSETNPMDNPQRIAFTRNAPYVIGDFYWTGWDYLGECGVGVIDYNKNTGGYSKPYPCIVAGCGLYDIAGHRDTMAYDLAIAWGEYNKPFIAVSHPKHAKDKMIPAMYRKTDGIDSWSFDGYEGVKTTVRVASVGKSVEVLVNGKSHGKKKLKDLIANFKVPYEKGEITAISFDENGKEIARETLRTAEEKTVINVLCEKEYLRSGGEDIVYFDVSLGDKNGLVKPLEQKVNVKVEGCGELLAVGSGVPRTEESYLGNGFTTWNGRMVAIVRSTKEKGKIKVTFSSDGLKDKSYEIESK